MAIRVQRWINSSPWSLEPEDTASCDGSDLPRPKQAQQSIINSLANLSRAQLERWLTGDETNAGATNDIWNNAAAERLTRNSWLTKRGIEQQPLKDEQGPSHEHPAPDICSEILPEAALGLDSTNPLWSTQPLLDPSWTFRLHSDPTATRIIYLDFNGHTTTGTRWNNSTTGSSFTSPAYDIDGDPSHFSAAELTRIQQIWQRVASDFAPFDVDVTTQAPPEDWLKRTSSSDTTYGIRVVVTSYGPYSSSAGGVSVVGSFTGNTDTPAFVYNRTVIGASEAISHEVGHTLGLSHDGKGTSTYYAGHGTGETSWAPIMGSSYNRSVTTWDTGQYFGTNNGSSKANYGKGPDDLAVITGYNGFGYQPDLVGNSISTASQLSISGDQVNQFGTIETREDLDYYRFDLLSGGSLDLSFDPYWIRTYVDGDGIWGGASTAWASRASDLYNSTNYVENGSNLDLLVNLYSETGELLATSNPTGLAARISLGELAAGRYFLGLDGIGYGNPTASTPTGYTDAASLGFYRISGTITGAIESLSTATPSIIDTANDTTDPITGKEKKGRKASTLQDPLINAPFTPPETSLLQAFSPSTNPMGATLFTPIAPSISADQLAVSTIGPPFSPWIDQGILAIPGTQSPECLLGIG